MSFDATFNGISGSSVGIHVLKANRSALPASRDQKIDIPGRPGSYVYSVTPGDRKITVSVGIEADDASDYMDKTRALALWLRTNGKKPLIFSDEPDKVWNAVVEPIDMIQLERDIELGQTDIEFVADSYAYKTVTETAAWNTAASPTITLHNEGTVPVPIRFVITSSSYLSSPRFRRGDDLFVLPSLGAGWILDVDGVNKSIILTTPENPAPMPHWLNVAGDFFDLLPGDNVLEFAATEGVYPSVAVWWLPAWL